MSFPFAMGIVCVAFFLLSLFFFLFALSSFFYPQSLTTVEVYPTDVSAPRRWKPILIQSGISLLAGAIASIVFDFALMPEISAQVRAAQLAEADEIIRHTFKTELNREAQKIVYDGPDMRSRLERIFNAGWELQASAWLEENEAWDVIVTKVGINLKCEAKRRVE